MIREFVAPRLAAMGYELVDVRLGSAEGRRCIELLVDKPGGVGADDCQAVGEHVSVWLDMVDPVAGRYMLQVSSPGFDRPLRTREHFERFAGSQVVVVVRGSEEGGGRRRLRGQLVGLREGDVVVRTEEGEVAVAFDRVERARIELVWDD